MSQVRFDGRAVIVTGAGRGLGRSHALLLASRGARVVVNDVGGATDGDGADASPADAVVNTIRAAGGEAVASYDSVATPEGGAAIVQAALDAFGQVDAVVHNAGILRDRSFPKVTPEDLEAVLAVHLKGAFHVARPAFEVMKARDYGRIVLTASASGLFGNFGQSAYGAAKMGLVGLSNVLAVEGERHGIRSNVVAPIARTRMTAPVFGAMMDPFDPAHVSPVVAWLCSEACDVTHEVFSVGAGRVARVFVGLTPGWFAGGRPPSIEDVVAHADAIRRTAGFIVPTSVQDEFEQLKPLLVEDA